MDPGKLNTTLNPKQVDGLRREIRLPISHGVVGKVATNGELVKVDDASQFDGVLVGDTTEVVQSVICCPILGRKSRSMAVIQAFHANRYFFTGVSVECVLLFTRMYSLAH